MKLSRIQLLFLILVIILLIISLGLGIYIFLKKRSSEGRKGTVRKVIVDEQRAFDDDDFNSKEFSKEEWIRPLENNAEGSLLSAKAQIRGKIKEFNKELIVVETAGELYEIKLPLRFYFYCAPLFFTDAEGKKVPASEVPMFFEEYSDIGKLVYFDNVKDKIKTGDETTVEVKVDENENMQVEIMAGYGCEI